MTSSTSTTSSRRYRATAAATTTGYSSAALLGFSVYNDADDADDEVSRRNYYQRCRAEADSTHTSPLAVAPPPTVFVKEEPVSPRRSPYLQQLQGFAGPVAALPLPQHRVVDMNGNNLIGDADDVRGVMAPAGNVAVQQAADEPAPVADNVWRPW